MTKFANKFECKIINRFSKRAQKHKLIAIIKELVSKDRIIKLKNYGMYKLGFNFKAENEHENQLAIITKGEAQQRNLLEEILFDCFLFLPLFCA